MRNAPGKPPSARRRFGDGEAEIGLDRRRPGIEIVPIERKSRLEPQRIAGAEADRLHFRLPGEKLRDFGSRRGGDGYLEAVLAGIAGSADPGRNAADLESAPGHEGKILDARRHPDKRFDRLRALQRDERLILKMLQGDAGGQLLAKDARYLPLWSPRSPPCRSDRRGALPSGRR
jgi:hypothetical protein